MPAARTPSPLSGRRAEAARNDAKILEAAREVFIADPTAPITAVAKQAGVGISALYSRYGSKEELLRTLCHDGLAVFVAETEAALADEREDWEAFADYMRRLVDADTSSMTLALAGTFTPTEEMFCARRAGEPAARRILRAGASRSCGTMSTSTTSRLSSSSWQRSRSATANGPSSCAGGTWR